MQDYFYLEMYYNIIDGKKKVYSMDLFNGPDLIMSFGQEDTKYIKNKIKEQHVQVKNRRNEMFVDDRIFIKQIVRTFTAPKRKPVNKKMIGLVVGTALIALAGVNKLTNNNNNANNNTTSIVVEAAENTEDDFKDMDVVEVEDTNEKDENEINTIDNTGIINIEEIETPIVYETVDNHEESLIDNGFENIFEFSYEDRSNSENTSIVESNYSNLIDTYSKRYGIDSKLMSAIICQENPTNQKNYREFAGHGVPQIEWIHNNSEIYAYNYETNKNESSGLIDVMRCTDDQDYSIKIACMIMNNNYNYIHEKYGYKLTKEQELSATVWSYNKGITIITDALAFTDSYEDFKDYVLVNSIGGDNEYVEHVFSYIPDEEIVTMKTRDGLLNSVMIDNTTVENHKRPSTL